MSTKKALKVSKAFIVLMFGIVWVLLRAVFTLFELWMATPVRVVNDQEKSEPEYDPLTNVTDTPAMHPEVPKHYFE